MSCNSKKQTRRRLRSKRRAFSDVFYFLRNVSSLGAARSGKCLPTRRMEIPRLTLSPSCAGGTLESYSYPPCWRCGTSRPFACFKQQGDRRPWPSSSLSADTIAPSICPSILLYLNSSSVGVDAVHSLVETGRRSFRMLSVAANELQLATHIV